MNSDSLIKDNPVYQILELFPAATALYTSEDIIINYANSLMLDIWGKDETIIGMPVLQGIPELKDQPFIDILKHVWRTGITYSAKDTRADLLVGGKLQTFYFDFTYQALKNENSEIYAIFHTSYDVTEKNLHRENADNSIAALSREQSLNEELAASNEELVSTIEELNTTQQSLSDLNEKLEEKVLIRTKALAQSESKISYLLDDAPVAIALFTGSEMLIEAANKKVLEAWGKTSEVVGKPLQQALPELIGQPFLGILDEVYRSGKPFYGNEVKAMLEKNGVIEEVYCNFVYQPSIDNEGNTFGIILTANIVTEQVLARRKVDQSQHRLNSMVSTAPIGMTILRGRDMVVEIANQPMLDIWNHNKEEVIGRKLLDIFPELTDQPYPELLLTVFDTGKKIRMPELEADIISPHGNKHIYIDFSYDPLFDENGEVEAIQATVIDITEIVEGRKMLEKSEAELQYINEELSATVEELAAANEELLTTQDTLQEMFDSLASSESRFRFMLNVIPQQVWTASPDGALDYVNQVVCTDFGYTTEEVVGHGWKAFIHPEDLENCLKKWTTALETGGEYEVEFRLLFKDGTYRWHLARAVPLIENQKVSLWLGTNTDIEIQKEKENKKDEFLSIASHELKTPLTSIKAFNQLMQKVKDPVKIENFIHKSSEHITRLEKLISDLLDVTKINAGKLVYNMEPFNFEEMVRNSIDTLQHTSSEHHLVLEINEAAEYNGDRFRLEMVLNNFIYNAVKYSPGGEKVIVNSRLERDNIVVSVQDFGIGIEEEDVDKLFDRYYRVDNTAMRFDGLGLGLFICSEILKRHNGSFWIESKKGEGSTFFFRLPLQQESSNKIIKSTDSFYKDNSIVINYNEISKNLEIDWIGFESFESVQKGCMKALEMINRFECSKVLNDNRRVLGTWSDASDWVGTVFFPMMENAGVKNVAWIFSPSSFSQLSAKKSLDVAVGNITAQFFTDMNLAKKWLAEV
ncbi:PAS domain S-box protein [Daejeonella oryzae]|uniref:PAS domain S-box protein n=1 Tax=Daejeonella oryzae TaxID=1122943 RepID=UPI000402EE47|nr:PAS domain S-box protein [Daejeonella oryzae]